jgi:hypothetical protein
MLSFFDKLEPGRGKSGEEIVRRVSMWDLTHRAGTGSIPRPCMDRWRGRSNLRILLLAQFLCPLPSNGRSTGLLQIHLGSRATTTPDPSPQTIDMAERWAPVVVVHTGRIRAK